MTLTSRSVESECWPFCVRDKSSCRTMVGLISLSQRSPVHNHLDSTWAFDFLSVAWEVSPLGNSLKGVVTGDLFMVIVPNIRSQKCQVFNSLFL